jgi:aldehyde dehydrogenase (NAD+)
MAAKLNLKRVTLELGGKPPSIIFDDCDVDNAVKWTANGITANSGQVCFTASRVYVQEGIYDTFIEKYKQAMKEKALAIGDPDDAATQLGPLVDEAQFNRVMGFVKRGQKGQGKMLVGGSRVGDKVSYDFSIASIDLSVNIHLGFLYRAHRFHRRRCDLGDSYSGDFRPHF